MLTLLMRAIATAVFLIGSFACALSQDFTYVVPTLKESDAVIMEGIKSDEKMYKHFKKHFENAVNLDVSGNRISFTEGKFKTIVQYSPKGRWLYTVKTYQVKDMDQKLKDEIETYYAGYTVFGVIHECEVLDKKIQTVTLLTVERGNNWKMVRVTDDDIITDGEYTRTF